MPLGYHGGRLVAAANRSSVDRGFVAMLETPTVKKALATATRFAPKGAALSADLLQTERPRSEFAHSYFLMEATLHGHLRS